jgi:hypothetical protein
VKITTFAPHLAGRMLPAMFDYLGIGKVERFPGDPYAHQQPWAAFFWMHTTECGTPNHIGSSKAWTIPLALRTHELERRNSQQVLKAERTSADATDRERSVTTSPGVGPMGAWQPADAGPIGGQAELFAGAAA